MNKKELIISVSEKSGFTQKDSEKAISAFLDTVTEALENHDSVQLIGFGTFGVKRRSAREGRNPATGEHMSYPEAIVPVFKPGKSLKDKIAKK